MKSSYLENIFKLHFNFIFCLNRRLSLVQVFCPSFVLEGTSQSPEIDLTELASRVWESIKKREYLEKRHSSVEDDGLVGMLNFMCNILKCDTDVFKFSKQGMEAVDQVSFSTFVNKVAGKIHFL